MTLSTPIPASSWSPTTFEGLDQALSQLVLPATGPKDTFDLFGMGIFAAGTPLERLSVKPEHFPTPEEHEQCRAAGMAWKYQHLFNGQATIQAAFSLQRLLGHLGDPETQAKAIYCFETYLPQMSLSLNALEDHLSIWDYLEEQDEFRRTGNNKGLPPLFSQDPLEQEDRYATLRAGIWTVTDHTRGPRTRYVLAAASTPGQALAKAWRDAPHLKSLLRMDALDAQLPEAATPSRRSSPRF